MSATGAPTPRPRLSRRPRLSSPRAWFLSRPQVQAVVHHPGVQWAMTSLGIRRWRAIRRWPPVLFAIAFTGMITDPMHGPRWQQDLIKLALLSAVIVTALATDAYLTRRALRLAALRSRPAYLAAGTGLLVLAVGCFTAVARLDAHNTPALADVSGLIGLLASWSALLSLGRALTWGRLRRLCWIYPPDSRLPARPKRQDAYRHHA